MTTTNQESERRQIHPLASIARWPRIAGQGSAWMFIATVQWGDSFSGDILILFAGLVWPHLAYWMAISGTDTKKAALAALAGDSLAIGLAVGVLQFATLSSGVLIVSTLSVMTLLGGVPLLLRSSAWATFGGAIGFLVWGFEPNADLSSLSELLLVGFIGSISLASNWAGHRAIVAGRAFLRDLEQTNTVRAELIEALERSQSGLQALFESAHDAIVTADNSGFVMIWNPQAERLFGWTVGEMEGKHFSLIFPEWQSEDIDVDVRRLARGEGEKGSEHSAEMVGVDREGRRFPVEVSVARFGSSGSRTYSVFIRDISARKEAEEALVRSTQELAIAVQRAEEANQAKSRFLANMSHELRTPLNAVIGYSEMLEENAEEMGLEEFQSDLQKIQKAARHLLTLINDVLDLAKIEAERVDLEIDRVDLPSFLSDVTATVAPLVDDDRVDFRVEISEGVGEIETDQTKLRQILMNLLSNAVKFTAEGSITVLAHRFTATDARQWVALEVSDTGIGMTDEQQDRVFGAFEQADASTSREFGGTGLGLAITRTLSEMLGGSVEVRSEIGTGSSFIVTLPASTSKPPEKIVEQP